MLTMWLYFVNLLFIAPSVLCNKRIFCDFSDEDCVTAAQKVLFIKLLAGNATHNIPSSDPLYQKQIDILLPYMKVKLNNAYMHGTKACEVDHLRMEAAEWYFSIICPKLTLKSDYEINGLVGSLHVEGKGKCEITYDQYHIHMYGGYDTYTGKNGKEYINVTLYKMDSLEAQGGVVYNFKNLFNGDSEKSTKVQNYINKNWKKLDNIMGEPVIYSLTCNMMDNINGFLKVIPKYELFSKN